VTDLNARLDTIAARADAATEGPWFWDENFGAKDDTGLALTNAAGVEVVSAYNFHCCEFRDSPHVPIHDRAFIAAARTEIPALVAALRAVLAAREQMQRERATLATFGHSAEIFGYDKCIELIDSALAAALEES